MRELNFKTEEINEAFRKFDDYSSDLLGADARSFDNYLNIFIDFCEHDSIMSLITGQLKDNSNVNLKEWHDAFLKSGGSFIGSQRYELPLNENDRISLLYQFLLAINTKDINRGNFCIGAFGKTNFDEMIWAFNENITEKLIRNLRYKLDKIVNKIKDKKSAHASSLVIIPTGQSSINQIAIGNDIKSNLLISTKEKELSTRVRPSKASSIKNWTMSHPLVALLVTIIAGVIVLVIGYFFFTTNK